jgi:hypothetical protein
MVVQPASRTHLVKVKLYTYETTADISVLIIMFAIFIPFKIIQKFDLFP